MPKVKIPRQWKFGSVPEEILFSNLSIFAKMAIAAITFHAFDDGPAWPGSERLSKLCSCSKRAVLRAIVELEKSGFLKVERAHGKVNEYQFLSKSGVPQSPVGSEVVTDSHQTSAPESPVDSKVVTGSHSNETLKINEKKRTPHGDFVDWFEAQYQDEFKKPYLKSKADFVRAAELLKIFQIETLKKLVFVAWRTKDAEKKFSIQTVSKTVKGFASIVNQLSLPAAEIQPIGWLERSRREREEEERLKRAQ